MFQPLGGKIFIDGDIENFWKKLNPSTVILTRHDVAISYIWSLIWRD